MSDIFDKVLHYYGRKSVKLFCINIGAMDGVMFDELVGYSKSYGFKGLYVEPVPYLFERLKQNFSEEGNLFENAAISSNNGTIRMMTIDQAAIDTGLVHPCFYGMSAVYPPKNGLGSEGDRETVEKWGRIIEVPCITLETLLSKHSISNFDVVKIDAEGHDWEIFDQIDIEKFRPKLIRLEWINLQDEQQGRIIAKFKKCNYDYEIANADIMACPKEVLQEINSHSIVSEPNQLAMDTYDCDITLVTGLWDIKRDQLSEGWTRSFEHYLNKFKELLEVENPMIIFGEPQLESFVFLHRKHSNTQFITRDQSWFKSHFFEKMQEIRTSEKWRSQTGWLGDSTQAQLEMYNPLVMSKMFLLNDARLMDPFNSKSMYWIDAGLTNTVHPGYFTHDKVLRKLSKHVNRFTFVCFPYQATTEIHGFGFEEINKLSGKRVEIVARGGFFGGPIQTIPDINSIYYQLMQSTLAQNLMGTEESLFSIMVYRNCNLIDYFEIESNGLMSKFFEDLKNDTLQIKTQRTSLNKANAPARNVNKTSLYVIGFNSPKQLKVLIDSMLQYDPNYVVQPKKYLLNNSTDRTTDAAYNAICSEFGFEMIGTGENLGICGGRQYVAEHFDQSEQDFMLFFEDDMFFYPIEGAVCTNGFNRKVNDLYWKSLEIMSMHGYDFLKLNFTEFFGNNSTQWAWYNVNQEFRISRWPNNPRLPTVGFDPNAPLTDFKNIRSHKGLAWADGDIYYSNWPQIVSKDGNRNMFLKTKWAHPYEQTWMSHIYQETIKGNIRPAILLLTPTEHNRFDEYAKELRKES